MVVRCEHCGKEIGEVPAEESFIGGYVCDNNCTKEPDKILGVSTELLP